MSTPDLISKIQKNKYVRFISITAVVLGGLITIGAFFNQTGSYLYSEVFIAENISDKVSNLSAGESINFFKQILGAEKTQRKVSDKYTEYVFQYKSAFVQALTDNTNNEVLYWAITYCGDNPVVMKRPVFSMAREYTGKNDFWGNEIDDFVLGQEILLNKSSFTDAFKKDKGDFKYFVSGATANSFAYESLYLGNPSAYQTIIIGVNDICPSSQAIGEYLDLMSTSTSEQIEQFREHARINTYGETSPFAGDEIVKLLDAQQERNEPYITFGVDRISVRPFIQ